MLNGLSLDVQSGLKGMGQGEIRVDAVKSKHRSISVCPSPSAGCALSQSHV